MAYEDDVYRGGSWPDKVDKVFGEINGQVRATLHTRSLYDLLDAEPGGRI